MTKEYSCLTISRKEFRTIYAECPTILAKEELFYTKPENDVEVVNKYLTSKLWRLNNVYSIVDKWGTLITFRMNRSQHMVYAASLKHPRLIILKSRQQGISTLWLVSFFDDAVFISNYNIGLMAQGLDESATLLDRTQILWDNLNPFIKQLLGITINNNNTKEFSFTNNSKFFIRTSFRSATLQRLHISEMGKIANKYPDKAKETKTGTLQALAQGNIGVVESTAEGDNMFKSMWDNAELSSDEDRTPKDFLPVFLSWIDDPDCFVDKDQFISDKNAKYFREVEEQIGKKLTRGQKNFWIVQYRELADKIYQEYPSTSIEAFMATKQGAYWAELYMMWVKGYSRIKENLYDKNLDVEVAFDLGMNDTNSYIAFQNYRKEVRVIGEFQDSNEPIKYYCDQLKKEPWFSNVTRVILPHDAEVKEQTSGKTRLEVYEDELEYDNDGNKTNIHVEVLERTESINDDIEKVRQLIPNLWVDKKIDYMQTCFLNFKREWDEKNERFKDKPNKDEAEQGASAIRYMACGRTGADGDHQTVVKGGRTTSRNGGENSGHSPRRARGDIEI